MTKQTPYQLMHLKATRSVIRQHEESLLGRTKDKILEKVQSVQEMKKCKKKDKKTLNVGYQRKDIKTNFPGPSKENNDDGYRELFKILVGNDEE